MKNNRIDLLHTIQAEVAARNWGVSNPALGLKIGQVVMVHLGIWAGETPEIRKAGDIIGHACLDIRFPDLSLKLINDEAYPVFGDLTGWPAVESYFGLTQEQAAALFAEEKTASTCPLANHAAVKDVATNRAPIRVVMVCNDVPVYQNDFKSEPEALWTTGMLTAGMPGKLVNKTGQLDLVRYDGEGCYVRAFALVA